MPLFQVRNKRAKIILGEVTVDDPSEVLSALADATGTTIDDIALSLGSSAEEAAAALDLVEIKQSAKPGSRKRQEFAPLPRRAMYG